MHDQASNSMCDGPDEEEEADTMSKKRGRSLSLRRKKQEQGALTMEHFQKKVVAHLKIMKYIFFSFL